MSALGERLDERYEVVELIGEGGYGDVYLARDKRLGRDVAVKLLRPHPKHGFSKENVLRFEREAVIIAALKDPSTIKVHDHGRGEDGVLHIIMEYIDGQTIDEVLASTGAMHPGRLINVLIRILRSISEAHRRGILHRDLKPSNVLLYHLEQQPEELVKVLDFGIAKSHAPNTPMLTQPGRSMGTAMYSAPEVRRGSPASAGSDIYCVGLIALQCLAGTKQLPSALTVEDPGGDYHGHISVDGDVDVSNWISGFLGVDLGHGIQKNDKAVRRLAKEINRLLIFDPKDRAANAFEVAERLTHPEFRYLVPKDLREISEETTNIHTARTAPYSNRPPEKHKPSPSQSIHPVSTPPDSYEDAIKTEQVIYTGLDDDAFKSPPIVSSGNTSDGYVSAESVKRPLLLLFIVAGLVIFGVLFYVLVAGSQVGHEKTPQKKEDRIAAPVVVESGSSTQIKTSMAVAQHAVESSISSGLGFAQKASSKKRVKKVSLKKRKDDDVLEPPIEPAAKSRPRKHKPEKALTKPKTKETKGKFDIKAWGYTYDD